MGLDITAYKNIEPSKTAVYKDGEPVNEKTGEYAGDGNFICYINPDFKEQAGKLKNRVVYSYKRTIGFGAGSYSGYNYWRETLAKLAGYPAVARDYHGTSEMRHDAGAWKAQSGPFKELINFSDCEGVICSEVSKKLAKDFADWEEKAEDVNAEDPWFMVTYNNFKKAFEMAAQNGAVVFH